MLNDCRAKTYTAILFIVVTFNLKKRCLYCDNSGKTMSEYFKNLSKTTKRRYEEKIKDIGVENVEKGDPFLISSEWVDDFSKWPEVEFGQIYVYVIDLPGPYTRETMKAYSSFEAYQQFSMAGENMLPTRGQ